MQPLLLSACIVIGMMIGFKMNNKPDNTLISAADYPLDSTMMTGRVEELIRFIESKYVDEINSDVLITEAVNAIFLKLDPHSVYLSPEELDEVTDQMDGNYSGIGIEQVIIEDTINISAVMPDSPAKKAGLLPFDKILTVNQKKIAGKTSAYSEIRHLMRNVKGERVDIEILRGKQKIKFSIPVEEVEVKTVHSVLMPEIQTVIIQIDRFGSATYKEFMEEVEKYFGNKQAKHLILDLRDNPGGFLPEATNILCQIFEEKERLLLYTEGRNSKRNEYKTNGKRFFNIEQVVVLIDENSASASEIIAGAIQDWDRGTIIGRRSYGKGLVQEQYKLNNGGAIRLTVARYYTPSGRSIQRDYSDRENYENDFGERRRNGDLFYKDSTLIKNGGKYFTQLKRREVSGAGGISPDVFVPMDSIFKNETTLEIKSYIPEFAFRYVSKNRSTLPNNLKDYSTWNPDDTIFNAFKLYVSSQEAGILMPTGNTVDFLKKEIKHHIGAYLFDKNEFRVFNLTEDLFVQAAKKAILKGQGVHGGK